MMWRKFWRLIAIGIWTVGATAVWVGLLTLGLYFLAEHPNGYLTSMLRRTGDLTVIYGLYGIGSLTIACAAALLGLAGRLPGTSGGRDRSTPKGSPVDLSRPSERQL